MGKRKSVRKAFRIFNPDRYTDILKISRTSLHGKKRKGYFLRVVSRDIQGVKRYSYIKYRRGFNKAVFLSELKRVREELKVGNDFVTARMYAVRPYLPATSGGEMHTESRTLEIVAYFFVPSKMRFEAVYSLGIKLLIAYLRKIKYDFLVDVFLNGSEVEKRGQTFIHGSTTSTSPSGYVYETEIWNVKYGVQRVPEQVHEKDKGEVKFLVLDTSILKKVLYPAKVKFGVVTLANWKELVKKLYSMHISK